MKKTSALAAVCAAIVMLGLAIADQFAVVRAQVTPTAACGRTLQNVTALLKRDYDYEPVAEPDKPDYCTALETELNLRIEAILAQDTPVGIAAESKNAQAFIDFGTRQYVGLMPRGTKFTAVARNALPGSQMIFVRGEGFAVFVDYAFTTLTQKEAETLPDYREYSGDIRPVCTVRWCLPPGPRPTQSN